jgi:hypothetical protein
MMTTQFSDVKVPRRFLRSPLGQRIGIFGSEAQLLAMYLLSSPFLDTSGHYHLPHAALQAHTQIELKTLQDLLEKLKHVGFCTYSWKKKRVQVHVPLVTAIYSKLFNPTTLTTLPGESHVALLQN